MFGRPQQGNSVCKFYPQGRCKFGDGCKFIHPGANRPQDNQNSFAPLENNQGSYNQGNARNNRPAALGRGEYYRPGNTPQTNQDTKQLPYFISKDSIEADLKNEKPQWPFSAYGPGRDAPRQLFGGFPLEQSFEEMRVMYYLAGTQGNVQPAVRLDCYDRLSGLR